MCGICGVIGGEPRHAEPAVRRMMRAMGHRGPDGEGYEELPFGAAGQGPAVALGFRRLAIIDLTATGHQPMFHPDTGDCLVFNGEIYNFKSLRAQLQCDGARFRGTSDTEVLLKALSTWGHAALARLRGMYAFAFYEAKSRRVLLARDPLGIKPLYVATGRQGLVFASEVRAILSSGLVSTDLDPAGIATVLAYGAPQDPLTVHRDVMSFPAGGYAWVPVDRGTTPRSPEVRRFWAFPRDADADPLPLQAASDVRSLLESAVAQHLVADRPVGLFLSAGIDSFAIAALAKSARADITSFTVGFAEHDIVDEVRDAESAARSLGIEHHRIILSSAEVEPMWHEWLRAADRPSIDGFNTFVVSRAVRDAGKTVALSGLGGDELFGGYPNFRSARRYAAILSAMGPVPRFMRAAGVRWLLRGRSRVFREKAEEIVSGGAGFDRVALRLRRILTDRQIRDLGVDLSSLSLDEHVLSPAALAAVGGGERSEPFNVISRLECGLYMGNTLLRDTDVVSMANALEVRVPLLDQSVVDYVLPLSERLKVSSGGHSKHLLRSALHGLIPESLLNRPKTGFSLPIHRWMHGVLRESCEAAIGHLAGAGVLDAATVRRIWGEFIESADSVNWTRPMTLVALGNYLRNVPVDT